MADREREVVSASLSRLLRTLSSASMSRRRCPLALLQPLPVRQSEMTSVESAERCCSSCSEDSNNNGRSKSEERETEAELEAGEGGGEEDGEGEGDGMLESKAKEEQQEAGEEDELELKRDSTVNVNVVRANFKCNDMECSLVLGDYVNGESR